MFSLTKTSLFNPTVEGVTFQEATEEKYIDFIGEQEDSWEINSLISSLVAKPSGDKEIRSILRKQSSSRSLGKERKINLKVLCNSADTTSCSLGDFNTKNNIVLG
jgi:hypothetical protein